MIPLCVKSKNQIDVIPRKWSYLYKYKSVFLPQQKAVEMFLFWLWYQTMKNCITLHIIPKVGQFYKKITGSSVGSGTFSFNFVEFRLTNFRMYRHCWPFREPKQRMLMQRFLITVPTYNSSWMEYKRPHERGMVTRWETFYHPATNVSSAEELLYWLLFANKPWE